MIHITGSYPIHAPIELVWPRIFDPAALMSLIPGCQQLTEAGPGEYMGQIQVGVASISGVYDTLVRVVEQDPPQHCRFQGEVSGPTGVISGQAAFSLKEVEENNLIEYEADALITGSLARLNPRFIEGVIQALIKMGLSRLDEQLSPPPAEPTPVELGTPIDILEMEGQIMQIVDLTVPIGEDTLSPPSVNLQLKLTSYHRGPTFWQASKVEMLLHTGSHVDFSRHVQEFGETAVDVDLSRVFGEALVVDLSFAGPNHEISVADLEAHAPEIRPGDIVLVRTDWTEKHWGNFPTYYMESPYCSPQAALWLVERGARAIGFDCFSEYCARLPDFTSEDFIIHKIILENGALLMQQMTNLSLLPTDRRFKFFAPFVKLRGAEGSPARFFALLDQEGGIS
jgi:kynurenine formamidase/carbon monoxide dehydrogenase subunit G